MDSSLLINGVALFLKERVISKIGLETEWESLERTKNR